MAVVLFFGQAYPHHLHYQEQFQLFLFDSTYVWEIVRVPGGVADLLGRFSTQFFLYAWVGALIIGLLLAAVQLLTLRLSGSGSLYGLSFVPAFLLWLFLLDENALMGGVWAVLLTLLAFWGILSLYKKLSTISYTLFTILVVMVLYWLVGPGTHYHRYPTATPYLLYAAWLSAIVIPLAIRLFNSKTSGGSKLSTIHYQLFTIHYRCHPVALSPGEPCLSANTD